MTDQGRLATVRADVLSALDAEWRSPSTKRRTVVVIWLLATAWILIKIRHGVQLSPDGMAYLDRAAAIGRGDLAFASLDGTQFEHLNAPLHFPPLYPVLLRLLGLLPVVSPVDAAITLNIACVLALAAGIVRLSDEVFAEHPVPGYWNVLLLGAVCLNRMILDLCSLVLTDLPFFALWVWILVWMLRAVQRARMSDHLIVAVLAAAAVLLRYPAVFLVGGAVATLGVRELRRRVVPWRSAVTAVVAFLPLVCWFAWVRSISTGDALAHTSERAGDGSAAHLAGTALVHVWESLVGLGAGMLGFIQDRLGSTSGPSYFDLPFGAGRVAPIGFGVLGIVVVVLAVATLLGRPVPSASLAPDAVTLARLRSVSVPTVVYVAIVAAWRVSNDAFVLQRYWGITAGLLWVVLGLHARTRATGDPGPVVTLQLRVVTVSMVVLLVGLA